MVFLQVVDVEVLEQFDVNECALTVFDIGALIELCERLAGVDLRDLISLDENAFEIAVGFARFGQSIIEVVLCDAAAAQ